MSLILGKRDDSLSIHIALYLFVILYNMYKYQCMKIYFVIVYN